MRTTTTAQIGQNALVKAGRDVNVSATSTKDVESAAVAAAGGLSVGIAGAVSVVSIGASLDADSQASLRDTDSNSNTASFADSKVKQDKVTGSLGNSEHVRGTRTEVSGRVASLGVASDMNESATASLDKTRAFVGRNSQIVAGGDVSVTATDRLRLRMNVAGAAGGFVGIGGAFGVATTKATSEAFVGDDTTVDAGDDVLVNAQAVNLDLGGAQVRSVAGAGGVVGVSAAVAVIDDRSSTRASLSSSARVLRADAVTVQARTNHTARAETFGASVGAIAIGASVARSEFNGETVAWLGAGVEIGLAPPSTVNSVAVLASDESVAYASATAGTAGILAGSGADARATAGARVQAFTSDNVKIVAQGSVDVEATSTPRTEAAALGINIGAGAVGASLANARSSALVEAKLGSNNTVTAAALDIQARRVVGAGPTTLAKATGASGGLLFGINATEAVASSSGTTSAQIGDGTTVTVTGFATVQADNRSQQTASGLGFSAGFIAAGADYARANSLTTTQALLGANVKLSAGTLQVLAGGADSNYAWAQAGSGGVVSAPFSEASTFNSSVTYARTGSGNNTTGNARKIDVGTLLVSASHTANFNSWIDSTNASLIGASGATATNVLNSRAEAGIGASGYVEADAITLEAFNQVRKQNPGGPSISIPGLAQNVPAWNVNSNSGGLADVPAASSSTIITTNALVDVAASASLLQTGSRNSPGVFKLDAWNDVTAIDRVKMASGGAISAASGKSSVLADTNNATVRVQDNAQLSAVGDISMGARAIANINTQTAVDVYGAVGVAPEGDSVSRFQAINTIDIGAAELSALNDVRLWAGANSSGTGNNIQTVARSDVYNNTAIPVNRAPVADAIVVTRSNIEIDSGADVAAVRNVSLLAEKGTVTASGVGIGKDIYREVLAAIASAVSNAFGGGDVSFETRTGRSIRDQASNVAVNGTVQVGTERKLSIEFDVNGVVDSAKTFGLSASNPVFLSVAGELLQRIVDLNKLIAAYSVASASADASIAAAAYKSEVAFLKRKLKDMGYPVREDPTTGALTIGGAPSISARAAAQQAVDGMTTSRTGYASERTTFTNTNSALTTTNGQLARSNTDLRALNVTRRTTLAGMAADDPARPALVTLIDNTATQIGNQTQTINTNTATINTNDVSITALTGQITGLDDQIAQIRTGLTAGTYSDTVAQGPQAAFRTISDGVAPLGNIFVRGDRLQGSGTLNAPGDAEIKVVNNGPTFLILKNLTIPPDDGGKIFFNNVDIKSNTQINAVNGGANGAAFRIFTADSQFDVNGNPVPSNKPQIVISSTCNPDAAVNASKKNTDLYALAPDIILQGDISNLRGLVRITSESGSIRIEQKRDTQGNIIPGETANIRAGQVEVRASNGDFVQSYTDTFFHTAGAPLVTVPGLASPAAFPRTIDRIDRNETLGAGIVANGSVLIAARYLNINGTIQSGLAEWGVLVPDNATAKIGTGSGSFAAARSIYLGLSQAQQQVQGAEFYEVVGATVAGLAGNTQGNWEQVKVSYNAREDRLELGGVRVQGGYVELFGQIFNTTAGTGAKVKVLDGYGQVKVDNQTNLPLWVNLLDTGKGVQGEVNITNILVNSVTGAVTPTKTTYVRDSAGCLVVDGCRTGQSYLPQANLRFVVNVGYDQSTTDFYRYSQEGIIGFSIGSVALDRYKISSVVSSNNPIARGVSLQTVSPSANTNRYTNPAMTVGPSTISGGKQQDNTVVSFLTPGRSWNDCNWWTLCINATHYQEFTRQTGNKITVTDSVKADYPIGIEFIGFDKGRVNLSSRGSVVLNSSVNNRNGDTSVTSVNGSITQNGDQAILGGNNISLSANTGIGATGQALQVNVKDGSKLDAIASSGEVRVKQVLGDLKFGTVGGVGVSNVVLEAERNLLGENGNSYVQGRRVELLARNGAIGGGVADPLNVRTGYTTNQAQWPNNGLMATARDNINIRNSRDPGNAAGYTGNLLLISAESLAGDVRVQTTGKVIDNNPFATTDTRTQTELANLWDSLRLRGALAVEKADEAVLAFKRGKENNYQLYWLLRKGQADRGANYDPGYQYQVSGAENTVLTTSGLNATQIVAFAANRTAQYHALHAEVGGFTGGFTVGYQYTVSAVEDATIRQGSSWSDAQLQLSVGAGLLKNITDTVTTIKQPNAKGRNVTLLAGTDIGSFNGALTIDLTAGLNSLTVEQKAALAAAERGDATLSGTSITIVQPRPVNVAVGTGALNATASNGYALLGSEQDLRIDRVSATADIRIKTAGSLVNAASVAGAANVLGANIILEAANGGIGSLPDATTGAVSTPLRISPTAGSGVIARAANDIWLLGTQDLLLDTVFTRGNLRVDAQRSILDFHTAELSITPELNLRSANMALTANTGSIGTFANPLDVGVNATGFISATTATIGQGVYLNGPAGERFNIAAVTSGDAVGLSSATAMVIDGPVTGPGPFSLVAGGQIRLTPNADVHATTLGVFLRAGSLTMEDAGDGVHAAQLRVDAGTVDMETVGDALITGISVGNPTASAIRLVSTAGRILDNGDTRLDIIADTPPSAQLTISAALGVGADPLDVRLLNLLATSGGVVDLAVAGSVNILAISAADRVLLTAGGAITGAEVRSTGLGNGPDKTISITSMNGPISLQNIAGTTGVSLAAPQDVQVNTASSSNGPVALVSALGNVLVTGSVIAADQVLLTAGGAVTGNEVRSTGLGSGADKTIRITSMNGPINLQTVAGTSGVSIVAPLDVQVNTASSSSGPVVLASAMGNVVVTGSVSADTVAVSAPASIVANRINVGSSVTLQSDQVTANLVGATQPVGGSITGFSGVPASNVNLTLTSGGGFAFDAFSAALAKIVIPAGAVSVDQLTIVDRATFTNPSSALLIDQHDRSIQPFDLQLYSDGAPFALNLLGNRLGTSAFVIYRSPLHEALTPNSANSSVVEQSETALTIPRLDMPVGRPQEVGRGSGLVTVSGGGVTMTGQCKDYEKDGECAK
ncbi:MAG: hypothetical protein LH632_11260 [Rhodoferax sp.]|nr:hypothetical protein [Rhodoferax sp.]